MHTNEPQNLYPEYFPRGFQFDAGTFADLGGGTGFSRCAHSRSQRKFKSAAVERTIERVQSSIGNKELAWMFGNCFPNTLDTTVDFGVCQWPA